jgi:hypothetical protein
MAREILSKSNFFDFESPDSAISQFPMTLMKSMASLHQGPKASKAKPLNTLCDEIIELQGVPELADQTYRAFSLVITESNSV